MSNSFDGLSESSERKFVIAQNSLIPNENTEFVCPIRQGFLVLSNRRILVMKENKNLRYDITTTMPFDCYREISFDKQDCIKISGNTLDPFGCLNHNSIFSVELKTPKAEKSESQKEIAAIFHSSMKSLSNRIEEIKTSVEYQNEFPPQRNYIYFENLPEILTRNAILDLNTILQDHPIHDELLHEARKFLGDYPFILEESLRSGDQHDNGVLFAAGKSGYIWIQGRKTGRYMQDILVDKIEWENVRAVIHHWNQEDANLESIYSFQKGREHVRTQYIWNPNKNSYSLNNAWVFQKLNGALIFADLMYNFYGRPLPASMARGPNIDQLHNPVQRYYL